MLRRLLLAAPLLSAGWTAPMAVAEETGSVTPPSTMSNASIAEHNAGLTTSDPRFIRCRRIAIPGSLVKKARVCKSNADWAKAWQVGNQDARDTYDAMNRGSTNAVEPVDEFTQRPPRPN